MRPLFSHFAGDTDHALNRPVDHKRRYAGLQHLAQAPGLGLNAVLRVHRRRGAGRPVADGARGRLRRGAHSSRSSSSRSFRRTRRELGPIRDFGIVAAVGIVFTFFIFGIFLPAAKVYLDSLRERVGFPEFGVRVPHPLRCRRQ